MKKIYLLFPLLVILIACSKTPEKLKQDSDRFFNQATDYYSRGYLKQALDLFNKVIKIESKLGDEQRRANSYLYIGLIHYTLNDYDSALESYEHALNIFKSLKDIRSELLVLNNIAGIYSNLGNYKKAIDVYKEVIGKSLIFADKESEAIASLNIADVYSELNDFNTSFDYLNKSFDAYEVLGDTRGKIFVLNKIGELFIAAGNFPQAMKSFELAFELMNKNQQRYLIQEIYNNIGLIYFYENQITKAREIFELALNAIRSTESNQLILISIYNNLGDCDFKNSSYSKAIEEYKKALNICDNSYFKFLSPLFLLKIAKSHEKLYYMNSDEQFKKSAERFYKYAINRFEENGDDRNLKKALTSISSFYFRINEDKEALKFIKKLNDLNFPIQVKENDYDKLFALRPEFDYSFLSGLVKEKRYEEAYLIVVNQKIENALETFLKFYDFSFLDEELNEQFIKLKQEIFLKNTFQNIIIQELALPSAQRVREKIRAVEKKLIDTNRNVQKLLENLSIKFSIIKTILENQLFYKTKEFDNKLYIEIIPTEENLIVFFVSRGIIKAKLLSEDIESLIFSYQILEQNLDNFSTEQIISYSAQNFGSLTDEILSEIYKINPSISELIFLLNDSKLNLLSHYLYSNNHKKFLSEMYDIKYTYLFNNNLTGRRLSSIGILKNGEFFDEDTFLQRNENMSVQKKVSAQNKSSYERKIRIGFKEKTSTSAGLTKNNNSEFSLLIIFDHMVIKQVSPELTYFESGNGRGGTKHETYLKEILKLKPEMLLFLNLKSENFPKLIFLMKIFEFTKTSCILPVTEIANEISENFLYNYMKRVQDKTLSEAFKIFHDSFKNGKKFQDITLCWLKIYN